MQVVQNNKVEVVKNYKLTKCRYFDKGFCKYRKKCRYSHPEQTCEQFLMYGQCRDQNCPERHPQLCKFWQNNQNSCKRNLKCDFLHVTMVNDDDENQAHRQNFRCVSCKNAWQDVNCVVKHIIQGHETFFCLNCEDWVKFKGNVFDQNWSLFDEAGYLRRNI